GNYRINQTLLDLQGFVFGPNGGFFDGFSAGTGNCGFIGCSRNQTFNVTGSSSSTSISSASHEPKHVNLRLCRKNP
ncbi:MAG: hypothetical protein R3213_10980, partial [Flavobacteriaceae bacterium]|nr:hypothetical protein [Flavobacteriaceae bacterium]